jgi:hypothetical protein
MNASSRLWLLSEEATVVLNGFMHYSEYGILTTRQTAEGKGEAKGFYFREMLEQGDTVRVAFPFVLRRCNADRRVVHLCSGMCRRESSPWLWRQ